MTKIKNAYGQMETVDPNQYAMDHPPDDGSEDHPMQDWAKDELIEEIQELEYKLARAELKSVSRAIKPLLKNSAELLELFGNGISGLSDDTKSVLMGRARKTSTDILEIMEERDAN